MTMRRAALTAAFALALVSGCGSSNPGTAAGPDATSWRDQIKPGPLEVGVLPAKGTPGLKFLENLSTGLESEYPGSKVTLTFANTEARPGLEQRWRAGTPPDVDYGMFDGTVPDLRAWADDDALLDLTPYLQQKDPASGKPWLDRYSPTVRKFMEHPETKKIYAVPSELSLHVLFYNAKLFKDLGIKPPTTWNELLSAADALTAKNVDPIALTGLFEPYMGMWSDHLWLRTVGYAKARGVLTEGKGHITEDPGFLKGLQMLQDLRDKKAFLKGFKGTDFTAAQAQFFQGKAGMILMGSWLVSEMKDVIPKGFELGVVAFPKVDGAAGDQGTVMAALQNVSISAKSPDIPLALSWIDKLTSVETQTKRATEIGEVSAVVGVPSPPGVPGIDTVLSQADALQPRDFGLSQSKAGKPVYAEIARLLFGEQDADETLQRLDAALRRVHKN
ncbi:ABC transporter substrate-binding protein [Kribbella sp. NPDC056951]|uniref:ABC transporter substrate-binding protein n=1 Tax=Kribbella sp. NPDC056951 TaxID=3345978 RepID=UPI0036432B33